jgi:hypothetical protein
VIPADSLVRVALGLQPQRADLLRFQLPPCLSALAQPLVALHLVVRDPGRGGMLGELTVVGERRMALALSPQVEGLVLDDCTSPATLLRVTRLHFR